MPQTCIANAGDPSGIATSYVHSDLLTFALLITCSDLLHSSAQASSPLLRSRRARLLELIKAEGARR